jgi:hypothetical protein
MSSLPWLENDEKQKKCKMCTNMNDGVSVYHNDSDFGRANARGYAATNCKISSAIIRKQLNELRKIHGKRPPLGYVCYICGRKEDEIPLFGKQTHCFCLDHTHQFPFEFRGWLCHTCNKGIGFFNDDPYLFIRAAVYATQKGISLSSVRSYLITILDEELEKLRHHETF